MIAVTVGEVLDALAGHAPEISVRLVGGTAHTAGDARDAVIRSVTHDSRNVVDGSLFVCVRGNSTDGHAFADDAVASGASVLLVDHELHLKADVVQMVVEDTRMSMGPVAAAVLGFPGTAMTLIGVTGTNGKTTTAHALESILLAAGRRVEVIGTLTQTRTTPEATDLQARLAELRSAGTEIVIMEVTSHALVLHRVRGLRFAVAVFTNLSQDHLDFHPTMEAYFRAKAKLFTPEFAVRAIVNGDDPRGALLAASALIPTEVVHSSDAADLVLAATGSTFTLRGQLVALRMAGPFNVMNSLEAAAVARTLGIDDETIARGLSALSVPGRYELIDDGQAFAVIVDFAHTPDGLERLLTAAKATVGDGGRLLCVFGCGGDRDRAKRPIMGGIGASIADVAIITADNPRSEDPAAIAGEMLGGATDRTRVVIELDRRAAIERAIGGARDGDVVVIAGKGHEQGQEHNGTVAAFDDRDEARAAIRRLRDGATP